MCCAELPWIFVWGCTEKDHDALFSCIQAFNGCNFAHRNAHEKGKQHALKLSLGIADDGSTKRVLDDGRAPTSFTASSVAFCGSHWLSCRHILHENCVTAMRRRGAYTFPARLARLQHCCGLVLAASSRYGPSRWWHVLLLQSMFRMNLPFQFQLS